MTVVDSSRAVISASYYSLVASRFFFKRYFNRYSEYCVLRSSGHDQFDEKSDRTLSD